MTKKMFLHARFKSLEVPIIRFIVIPPSTEFIYDLSNILLKAFIACKLINKAFFATVKLMIYFAGILSYGTSEGQWV